MRAWTVVGVGALLCVAGCDTSVHPLSPAVGRVRPVSQASVGLHAEGGYVGSQACQRCHEATHASWHRSFHRTMTQRPSATSVLGRFDGEALDTEGNYRALLDDGVYRVQQPGPDGVAEWRPVELVTGSHHMQVYWVHGDAGALEAFAFAFLLPEQRWVPNEWTLLRPPAETSALAGEQIDAVYTWNRVCVKCHAVDGVPGYDADRGTVESSVAELGIACEACHGPGAEHIAARSREPLVDSLVDGDPTIYDPREGGAAKASEVCGQCHSISVFHDDAAWVAQGRDDPPPSDLSAWGRVVRHPLRQQGSWTDALLDADPDFFAQRYWSDGEVRVSGREYNGLLDSPCAVSEDFGCTTCHRMHETEASIDGAPWVDGQLKEGAASGAVCGRCHEAIAAAPARHAKHPAGDVPSCVDCHMPRTTYGLLGAIRSHTITTPSVEATRVTGRPLACNLCHLQETLGWSARAMAKSFGSACPDALCSASCTPADHARGVEGCVPAMAEWALAGDAGQRALAIWHLGTPRARAVPWASAVLAAAAAGDPYPAVRLIAERALRGASASPAPSWTSAIVSRRDDREVRLAE